MKTLTPIERRALRAAAHHLHPVVMIGQAGLSPAVLHEIDTNLLAHELIKVRVFSDERAEREALLQQICEQLDCAPVQHLGKLLLIYRPRPEEETALVSEPLSKRKGGTKRQQAEAADRKARGVKPPAPANKRPAPKPATRRTAADSAAGTPRNAPPRARGKAATPGGPAPEGSARPPRGSSRTTARNGAQGTARNGAAPTARRRRTTSY